MRCVLYISPSNPVKCVLLMYSENMHLVERVSSLANTKVRCAVCVRGVRGGIRPGDLTVRESVLLLRRGTQYGSGSWDVYLGRRGRVGKHTLEDGRTHPLSLHEFENFIPLTVSRPVHGHVVRTDRMIGPSKLDIGHPGGVGEKVLCCVFI